ncbi:MAG: Unknown protein [uncultured Sulfurovum sp.]|uniref:Lipoprotein n=1 Tax=uncultured Sulfurovum sp. TaxID=269237 RepID=A0A6S6T3G5_9BACT|nr:MAG: Unknown protein [uncultured Sulfurovum sp.]
MKKLIVLNIIVTLLFTSCASKFVSTPTYDDTITSFLITKDSNTLAVIGDKYHYIFNIDDKLKSFLLSKNKKYFTASFHYFKVDLNETVTGNYQINYTVGDTQKITNKWLKKHDFKTLNSESYYIKKGKIKGKRYIAKDIPEKYKFNKPYKIHFTEEATESRKTTAKMLTPITVGIDATIAIGVMGFLTAMYVISTPFGGKFMR